MKQINLKTNHNKLSDPLTENIPNDRLHGLFFSNLELNLIIF